MTSGIKRSHGRRSKSLLVVLGVIAAVSISFTAGRLGQIAVKSHESPNEDDVKPDIVPKNPQHERVPKSVNQDAPLPPAGTPLRGTFVALQRRSAAGDARAAKRIFDDLTTCGNRERHLRAMNAISFNRDERIQKYGPAPLGDKMLDSSLRQLDASDTLCDGVTSEQVDSRGEYLRQAAMLGDATAMVCYAESTSGKSPKYLSNAWFAYVERWKIEAPEFARRAFDAGQANVIPLLIDAYAQGNEGERKSFEFGLLIEPDQQRAYSMAMLFARLVPEDARARAQASAERLGIGLRSNELDEAQHFVDQELPRFASQAGNAGNTVPCPGVTENFDRGPE